MSAACVCVGCCLLFTVCFKLTFNVEINRSVEVYNSSGYVWIGSDLEVLQTRDSNLVFVGSVAILVKDLHNNYRRLINS